MQVTRDFEVINSLPPTPHEPYENVRWLRRQEESGASHLKARGSKSAYTNSSASSRSANASTSRFSSSPIYSTPSLNDTKHKPDLDTSLQLGSLSMAIPLGHERRRLASVHEAQSSHPC